MGSLSLLSTVQAGALLADICAEANCSGFALPADSSICSGDWCFRLDGVTVRLNEDLTLTVDSDERERVTRALVRAEARLEELAVQWGLKERALIGARTRRSGLAERDC
jgi:hypothetical protein